MVPRFAAVYVAYRGLRDGKVDNGFSVVKSN